MTINLKSLEEKPQVAHKEIVFPNAVSKGSDLDWAVPGFRYDVYEKEVLASGIDYRSYTIHPKSLYGRAIKNDVRPTLAHATGIKNATRLRHVMQAMTPKDSVIVVQQRGDVNYNICATRSFPHVVEISEYTLSSGPQYTLRCIACETKLHSFETKYPFLIRKPPTDCPGLSVDNRTSNAIRANYIDFRNGNWIRTNIPIRATGW